MPKGKSMRHRSEWMSTVDVPRNSQTCPSCLTDSSTATCGDFAVERTAIFSIRIRQGEKHV